MEKIDSELLIKEISSRLPYGVKVQVLGWDEEKGEVEIPLRIYSINTDGYVYFEANDYDVNYLNVDDCLLYLRPMSNMTEEEQEHCGDLIIHEEDWMSYYDYLDSRLLDYRGLIEKGLALEAPEDMYKL